MHDDTPLLPPPLRQDANFTQERRLEVSEVFIVCLNVTGINARRRRARDGERREEEEKEKVRGKESQRKKEKHKERGRKEWKEGEKGGREQENEGRNEEGGIGGDR